MLWNAAEAAEKRKDAQVAREIVLALPANAELTDEDRVALARSFAEQHFVSKGLAVQLDVHGRMTAGGQRSGRNWHAHLLITTRRIEGDRLAAKKARDLDPEVRLPAAAPWSRTARRGASCGASTRTAISASTVWSIRVDPAATHAQEHIGPVRMRRAGAEIVERAETIRQANEAAARDPAQVLATLTRHNATFTERDLDRYLAKHIAEDGDARERRRRCSAHAESRPWRCTTATNGEAAERYTTRRCGRQERAALPAAGGGARPEPARCRPRREGGAGVADIAAGSAPGVRACGRRRQAEADRGPGRDGQEFYALQAVREAHERAGQRVVGLAPTNAVAQDLKADGFSEAGTVHAELFRLKNGRTNWDRRTVVVVDEAAMLDSRVTGELLAAARQAGAKVILAGDDRQLASIERGGLFSELRQRHGAAEITEVTRQPCDWQRQAARDLAEGRFAEAVAAFDRAGAITWTDDQEEARGALVAAWKRDAAARPGATRFVFAYTNRDVDALNAELRQVRRDRGELTGPDVRFETKHGAAAFAVGDRVQFTDTLKAARIYNGNVGTITGIDAGTGLITGAAGRRQRRARAGR